MGNKLYLECFSGISGDMTVASLIDLGADEDGLLRVLKSLPVSGFDIKITKVKKSGLECVDFDVVLDDEHQNHDHDMEYLYGHTHAHENNHSHSHEHRGFYEIKEIIEGAECSRRTKDIAIRIFEIIANAEAKVHGEAFENVHFHEVGAVDSIVDILAVAYCIDNLDISEVVVPYLCEGQGTVRCQHGILPVPVPAVATIVATHGIGLKMTGISGELVTPTGAAIVAALRTSEELPEVIKPKKIGMGAGKRDYGCVGVVRAILL